MPLHNLGEEVARSEVRQHREACTTNDHLGRWESHARLGLAPTRCCLAMTSYYCWLAAWGTDHDAVLQRANPVAAARYPCHVLRVWNSAGLTGLSSLERLFARGRTDTAVSVTHLVVPSKAAGAESQTYSWRALLANYPTPVGDWSSQVKDWGSGGPNSP